MNEEKQRRLAARLFPAIKQVVMNEKNCYEKIILSITPDAVDRFLSADIPPVIRAEWSAYALKYSPDGRLAEEHVAALVAMVATDVEWSAYALCWTPDGRLAEEHVAALVAMVATDVGRSAYALRWTPDGRLAAEQIELLKGA